MERGGKTNFILKQFRKKSKKILNRNYIGEFFYLNKEREVIEFLKEDGILLIEKFFKKFISKKFCDFIKIRIVNEVEEEIKTWYYNEELISIIIDVDWGFKKQNIFINLDSDNFTINVIENKSKGFSNLEITLLNDYLISFLSIEGRALSKNFDKIIKK